MSRKHKNLRKAETGAGLPGDAFLNSYKPFIIIFVAGFLLYYKTFFFNFTYLDDNALILDKFDFISSASNMINFFREDAFHSHLGGSYYRPMLTVSFMLDALWGGKDPGAYHFTNVILHLCACCLLFRTLVKLNCDRASSFFYSLLFTVHPVLTQAVAWIPGRNDSLLAVFALLSFLSFLSFLERRGWARLAAHLLFLSLALLTKENAVFICALCFFFAVFIDKGRQPQCGAPAAAVKGPKPPSGSNFPLYAGWALVVAAWFFARREVLKSALGNADFDVFGSLAGNSPALAAYLGKIFFPFNLGTLPILKDLPISYGIAAAVLLGALIYISAKRREFIVFGLLWFLAFLLPSFIQSASAVANFSEHRIYLPFIGIIFMLVELDIPGVFKFSRRGSLALGAGILCLFFAATFSYCENFRDRINFWKKAVESSPSYAFNCNNLGSMYYLEGNMSDAERMWKKAVSINPEERLVHNNLGLIYMNSGKLKAAEDEYLKEINLNPLYDNVYFNLGLLYYSGGFMDKAEASWETALEINPDFAKVYANLAFLNYQKKDISKAKLYIGRMRDRGFFVQPELLSILEK